MADSTGKHWFIPIVTGRPHFHFQEEFSYRRDLRSECVFTIDPTTARDLDDALHIKPSDEEGYYEVSVAFRSVVILIADRSFQVGVHIADVSWFVKPDTELDAAAQRRATSVYLVHKVSSLNLHFECLLIYFRFDIF